MHLKFTPDQEAFRTSARSWLENNAPEEIRPDDGPGMADFDRRWQRRLYDAGWAGVSWPKAYGGRGLSAVEQLIWWEECARVRAPQLGANVIGLSHAGPTLIAEGDADQRAAHLPAILKGEALWCQGFSEPNAGSDLGALRTKATVDGDCLIVTGQKIWTGFGQFADFQELLVRTSTSKDKHGGISWVICDMRSAGIDIRPIPTMDGEHRLCEVFYDDVRIPLGNVVGGLDRGWHVAMVNLGFERATGPMNVQLELCQTVRELAVLAAELPGTRGGSMLSDDDRFRESLSLLASEVRGLRSLTYATASSLMDGQQPGAESAVVRLYFTELIQRVLALAIDLLGERTVFLAPDDDGARAWIREYMHSFKDTIAGGTSDIQRNTIARRVLGLPRSA